MNRHFLRASWRTLLLAVAVCQATLALAQDSFGGGRPAPGTKPQPTVPEALSGYGNPSVPDLKQPQAASGEDRDFGVAPQKELRASDQLHGPTPNKIPGGLVVSTQTLAKMLQNKQSGVLLLHVYGPPIMLPDAKIATPASAGGSFHDATQQAFGQYLQQITGGDKSRPLVTYCEGVQCWMSYNAALRAINMGYQHVSWYRGGLQAWTQAGLPTQNVGASSGAAGGNAPNPPR